MLENAIADIREFLEERYFGKYRGIVKEVDPKTGYIKAIVPKVWGKDRLSPPIIPCVPFAGNKYGLVLLPEKEDGVWVEFEAGLKTAPLWTGFWWAKDESPAQTKKDAKIRGIITPGKLEVLLDDTNKEIKLVHPDGPAIKISKSGIELKVGPKSVILSKDGLNVNDGAFKVS